MNVTESIIRVMHPQDLEEVVELHIRSFEDFFLTSLGKGFLYLMYQGFLRDKNTIGMVIEYGGCIRGFAIGSLNPDALFSKMLWQRGPLLFLKALKALFRNPVGVVRKFLSAISYRGEYPEKVKHAALISSLGVDPLYAKKGFGSLLIQSFCLAAFANNASAVYLTTDKFDNDPVNSFYTKNGFKLESILKKSNGRIMNRYILLNDKKHF